MESGAPYFTNNVFYTHTSAKETGKRSRPGTSHGERSNSNTGDRPNVLTKDRERRNSLSRRASFSSPSKGKRRPSSSAHGGAVVTDAAIPPALPDFALATAAKFAKENEVAVQSPASVDSFSKMLSRTAPVPSNSYGGGMNAVPPMPQPGLQASQPSESDIIYQHIQEMANKRISTLDYLRKAHDGRVYWFNTLLFDKPDLARMPYFETRKLARRATNYLLLGLSLPTVIDLNSSTPLEFLRSLNTLFTEFDSYQQIHTENGTNVSSLSRARLPQMFRRGPAGKGRRTSGAGDLGILTDANGAMNNGGATQTPTSVISFGLGGEGNELLPGEEYTHLLTPSLPFDPDFFETFATLCDMLIDCYSKLISLIPTPKDCSPLIAELFTKVDSKVRKIIIQGVVKEFEDSSRAGLKQEMGSVGKVVLGGLM
ncbi:hypothetical protein JX265_006836 [Neoarthrinium moseri]|uniref:Uncharacterized protein n=1 Tax=Neoarthrinium moseri TaxID=1658444 RepID=A0A9P9WLD2_9PEZI|nr:uncharacterized protein JN550_002687 [Neoarthrinium moseri]KAI1868857.1 hypothetical protein JX265_006836 [Neoarthrinium moseri]KAI1874108.1 hypothetical protein JN550_002687 [Neoarthrinium moseri]